jgi:uncharacterized membrane protein YdjX (TVP38/TMEM64 family)
VSDAAGVGSRSRAPARDSTSGIAAHSARLRWCLIGLAVVGLCLLPLAVVGGRVDPWTTAAFDATSGPLALSGLVVALLALDTFLPVPSSILATVAGQRLGFVGATVAISIGLCLGSAVGYLVGSAAGSAPLERLVGPAQLERARALVTTRPGALALAVTRAVPVLSESVMLLSGAARTPPARTAAVCVLANTGLAMAYAGLGSAADGAAAFPLTVAGSVGLPAAAAVSATVTLRHRRVRHDAVPNEWTAP